MKKWISHNQGIFVSVLLSVGVVIWAYGCHSKVQSIITEDKVTRIELQVELDTEVKRLEWEIDKLQQTASVRFAELDRLDAMKAKLFEAVSVVTQTGTVNKAGLIGLIGTLSAIGLGIDNRIKDKVIKNRPLVATTLETDIDRG